VIAWRDARHDREAAMIRLRLTAVERIARWLRADEGFKAEGTQIWPIPGRIDRRRSGGGRKLDRRTQPCLICGSC
jgi:hypothetical protein